MGGETEHEDQVDRPVADHLVGDRGVAGLRVPCRRRAHRSRGLKRPRRLRRVFRSRGGRRAPARLGCRTAARLPKIAVPWATRCSASSGRLGVLHDPVLRAAVVQLIQVGAHPLQRPAPRSDPADRGDLGSEGQDRLDRQRCPEHGLCRSDAPAPPQVFQGVEAKPHLEVLARVAHGIDHGVQLCSLLGRARGSYDEAAQTARARLAVDHLHPPGMPRVGHNPRCLGRGLVCPRKATRQVDGDHVATGADEWLKAGEEVPHRGLRGRRQVRGLAQPRIERIQVGVVMLGPQVAVPADIQADLANRPPIDQRPWQVWRAVGHHGDAGPL